MKKYLPNLKWLLAPLRRIEVPLLIAAMFSVAAIVGIISAQGGGQFGSGNGGASGAASGVFTSGHVIVSKSCGTQPMCFTVNADVNYVNDATWAAGATVTITTGGTDPVFQCTNGIYPCSTGPSSSTNDIGKTAFGTANCNAISPQQCVTSIPQGTITSITSAHVAVLSSTAATSSANGSGLRFFAWGSIDTVQLQAAADAAYTSTTPTDVLLPCGNMFFDAVLFNPIRVTRSQYPVGFKGCEGAGSTELIPLPVFTCANGQACFINLNYVAGQSNILGWSDSASNIEIQGLGLDVPQGANFTGTAHTFIRAIGGNNLKNVVGVGYLWNRAVTNTDYGLECIGCKADMPVSFIFGNKPCHFQGGLGGSFISVLDFGYCGGSAFTSTTVDGTNPQLTTRNFIFNAPLTIDGSVNAATINVPAGTTVNWADYNSAIGGGTFFTGGKVRFNDTLIAPTSGGQASALIINNAAATVEVSHINYTIAAFPFAAISAGTLIDDCGNFGIYSSGSQSIVSGTGIYINCPSQMISSTTINTAANPTINTDTQLTQIALTAGYFNAPLQTAIIHGSGIYSSTAASTPALTYKVQLCTVSGCGSGTVVTLANIVTTALNTTALTNATWNLTMLCAVNTTGATGNLNCHGLPGLTLDTGATLSAPDTVFADTNTATLSNIDLSAALFLRFTVAQSVAGASNSYTQQIASIR